MKFLKNYFHNSNYLSLKLIFNFFLLIISINSDDSLLKIKNEKDIIFLKNFFENISINITDNTNIINKLPKEYNIVFFISEPDLIVAGAKINESNYLIVKTENNSDKIINKVSFLEEKSFEHYLLSNKEIFNKLKNNPEFLLFFFSQKHDIINNDLKSLQAYIFQVKKPEKNCTLAAVVGEDRFFTDITEKENELYFFNLPVLYFTELPSISNIFFCHINELKKLNYLSSLIEEYWPDNEQKKIFINALKYKSKALQKNTFKNESFFSDLKKSLGKLSQKYDFSNIEDKYFDLLIETIKNFLLSNNISSFTELKKTSEDFKQELADRFFTAKTTAFFRDWRDMFFLKDWLNDLDERCEEENRTIKIKVFGCSTGQEVLSYAFELLNNGIDNFKILASDIDTKVLNEAKSMRYKKEKLLTLPTTTKNNLIKNYFEEDNFGNLKIRYEKFFNDRIHFMIQDITLPMSKDIPKGFEGPYDIVSVKNILLYLDETSRKEAIENIKNIVNNLGIIVLKDKSNKASSFLNNEFSNFIGINDYMVIKEPSQITTSSLQHILNLFEDNMPSQFIKFFYNYAIINKNTEIPNYLMQKALKAHTDDLYALEALYNMYKNENNYDKAYETLKMICLISPFQFINLYSQLKEDFLKISDPALNKCILLLSYFAKENYDGKTFSEITNEINTLISEIKNVESFLILTEILNLRDLGILSKTSPSKDGKWINLALKLIDEYLNNKFDENVFEHKIKILNNLYNNYPNNKDYKNINYLENLFDKINIIPPNNYGITCKLAIGEIAILFGDLQENVNEKSKRYLDALNYCKLKNSELNLLSDKDFGNYYTVLSKAYSKLAFLDDANFTEKEISSYLSNALITLEEALFVKTVYGYEEIKLKNKILKKIDENIIRD